MAAPIPDAAPVTRATSPPNSASENGVVIGSVSGMADSVPAKRPGLQHLDSGPCF